MKKKAIGPVFDTKKAYPLKPYRGGTMKKRAIYWTTIITIAVLGFGCAAVDTSLATVPYMNPEQLLSVLDNPEVIVLDVRTGRDWQTAEFKIKGAQRMAPEDFSQWADQFPQGKTLVLY